MAETRKVAVIGAGDMGHGIAELFAMAGFDVSLMDKFPEMLEKAKGRIASSLDKMVESVGGEAIAAYDQKVSCCGGALAFSEPEKSQKQIKDIVESAYDHGADMIVTPCPLCQANVEIYQGSINRKYGTKFDMPVMYYSQLMTVAYGGGIKEAGLDGQVIRARKLEEIAIKEVKK